MNPVSSSANDPAEWEAAVGRAWPVWAMLPDDLRGRVVERAERFAGEHRWEAAHGFELPAAAVALIAAQAALLLAGLPDDALADMGPIIVHPDEIHLDRGQRVGAGGMHTDRPAVLDGRAEYRGPLLVSWRAVQVDARHPGRGRNVVVHEIAHQLDMATGVLNGTPIGLADSLAARWARVCESELRRLRASQPSRLRDEAGEDPGEFFAIATETFLTTPEALGEGHPALYELLRRYTGLDPLSWRPTSPQP